MYLNVLDTTMKKKWQPSGKKSWILKDLKRNSCNYRSQFITGNEVKMPIYRQFGVEKCCQEHFPIWITDMTDLNNSILNFLLNVSIPTTKGKPKIGQPPLPKISNSKFLVSLVINKIKYLIFTLYQNWS